MKFSLQSPHAPRSKHSYEWSTPLALFQGLDAEFHFTIDVCATIHNNKCDRFYTFEQDGLASTWAGERVWCNPPYGRGEIDKWVRKAHVSTEAGDTPLVVMLLPNNTDTHWWHTHCLNSEIRFLRGRLNFGGMGSGTRRTRFGSAVVIFRER